MDKPSDAPLMTAPGQPSGVAVVRLPGSDEPPEWPAIDDYLDDPEFGRWERVGGERVWASPAKHEHAVPHLRLDYLIGGHARAPYIGASDLKTRVSADEEAASDACLFKEGIDPKTGGPYLEELSFEVVNKRPRKQVDARARAFAARGVRRQIAIDVHTGVVSEWDKAKQEWRPLDPKGRIHDKCLARPLSVAALLDAALADDEVARALEAKGNPAIVEMKAKSREAGREKGREEGREEGREITLRGHLEDLCGALNIAWSEQRKAAVQTMSLSALEALWKHLTIHKKWPSEYPCG